jgi:hypothetical protein
MLPTLATDKPGALKVVFDEETANELTCKVHLAKQEEQKSIVATSHGDAAVVSTKSKKGIHGLAPVGMKIPVKGKAFRVGGGVSTKQPLKESNQEKYNRIKAEKEAKSHKKNKRAVKKLKKEGKVGTLASFMYS